MKPSGYTFFLGKYRPVLALGMLYLLISLGTRVFLSIYAGASVGWTPGHALGIFLIGLFFDLCSYSYLAIPLVLHIWLTSERVYRTAWKWLAIGLYLGLLVWIGLFNLVPKEYNRNLTIAVFGLVLLRFFIYLLLLWRGPAFRNRWRKGILQADFLVLIFLLLFNAVSEFFFWQEFGSRYNFIAVDYLVYTNEVIGNINESYPVGWIVLGVLAATVPLWWSIRGVIRRSVDAPGPILHRTLGAVVLLSLPLLVYLGVRSDYHRFSQDNFANELAGNGLYEFGAAFLNNELDYYKFYNTLDDRDAFRIMRRQLAAPYARFTTDDVFNLEREISYPEPERKLNVVLISVESLSASFMKAFGNTQDITPQLDSLAGHSLFFTNLYATGTRTVRGLEALSLSIPPVPGQSVVRRPDNENLFSLGGVFKSKGYQTQFIYGGYSSFDNMGYFFSHNNYQVIDRSALRPEEIHYANIWGVADEDIFQLALRTLDADYRSGKPFFTHIMTVSNHRPYTYPKGRIDISPDRQIREGAVKYTDYAIGKFLRDAQAKPWFSQTVFIVVADHCAYAAGKVDLPVNGYHIPMLIYSPSNLAPRRFDRLTSQLDIAPTILGLLHMRYRTKFYGQDVLHEPEGTERAFISTYQGLGYTRLGQLIIQMPPRKVEEFSVDFPSGKATRAARADSLVREAIAYYQTASWLLSHRRFGMDSTSR
ncbi:MAG TPA: sulfatase-like hydrolase/transferase [Chitinophagaceae bacterium]|nr:sulfatase-like hydrolase/transferase [Chitinophagaceae bacterium]